MRFVISEKNQMRRTLLHSRWFSHSVTSSTNQPSWNRRGLVDYLKDVIESRVYDVSIQTPLTYAKTLSKETIPGENTILLKREDLQTTFSFNIRGAHNKIAHLSPLQCKSGIVACSAGNHAQGVAYSASKLGIDTIIVVPVGTIRNKVANLSFYMFLNR